MLSLKEINTFLSKLNNWSLESETIVKDFVFKDFKTALEFVNKVGEVAERMEHHPDIIISFNRVKLSLTTHSAKGLTKRDFEVAEEIDKIHKEEQ